MIIQRALKGIANLTEQDAKATMEVGILCNWWRNIGTMPQVEIPHRLAERNLDWHQNHYNTPDPLEAGEVFSKHTPFISLTSGTVERNEALRRNFIRSAI